MTDVSVIGCGNMGGALLQGLASSGNYTLTACDLDPEARAAVEPYSDRTTDDLAVAAESPIVVLAVKPSIVPNVLEELSLEADQTLVSIAAGVPRDLVASRTDARVVRVMPNLAAETQSMAAAAVRDGLTDDVRALLADVGEFVEVDESLMDIATAVNGSGPAFVFYCIQAIQEAGIESGLEPDQARLLAAQTFKGAAETVQRSDATIEQLIDDVCSPKGTTIEGMEVLWDSDADTALQEAVEAAERRSRELARDVDE